MRSKELYIPFLRRKSRVILFGNYESVLKIVPCGNAPKEFTITVFTKNPSEGKTKYFITDTNDFINIKECRSFRIERSKPGFRRRFIAIIR